MATKEEIKASTSINDVLARYGLQSDKAGFICCPFHKEKTASLKIYPKTNSFYCWGCHTGGDIFKFVMLMEECNFEKAFEILGGTYDHKPISDSALTKIARHKRALTSWNNRKNKLNDEYISTCDRLHFYQKAVNYAPNDSEIYATALKEVVFLNYKIDCLYEELNKLAKEGAPI